MKTVAIISLTLNLGVIGIGLYGYLNKDKVINMYFFIFDLLLNINLNIKLSILI